jgi:iron only hydrogenase large subunit-like protein/uncharacterized Fe-S cluster-containing protein
MSIIQFKEANCKNCYKCIRSCPVKAIAFVNDQARIVEEDCMYCGNCLTVCPQNAKSVQSEIDTVKGFFRKKEKVYVSLAPSFISAFENADEKWFYAALKRLGFTFIEETAVGAVQVSKEYDRLIREHKMKNIITTACPSITLLVRKYYPELLEQLAPVVSPMTAHGKMLRETYGPRIRVVFIGPCLSKKDERREIQNSGVIDAAITFEELEGWFTEEGIGPDTDFSEEIRGARDLKARIYPLPGGILKTVEERSSRNYQCISVDGVDRCMKVLDSIRADELQNYFIEMNSCSGGCIGGPCMKHIKGGFLEARARLISYVKRGLKEENLLNTEDVKVDLRKTFYECPRKSEVPSEAAIQGILNSIGKFTRDKELNCGACGYSSCRDKAAAVYNNRAQLHMCLPYMRERAESISNLIINTTPNAIFALDDKLLIQEANRAAHKFFSSDMVDLIGKSIFEVLECGNFQMVIDSKENIYDRKYYYEKYDMTVKQSIIYAPGQNIVVVIIQDISEEERITRQLHSTRETNVDLAQKVIEKQMRVAQEIASLLGETTAETKVALTKLKKSIMSEMGDE